MSKLYFVELDYAATDYPVGLFQSGEDPQWSPQVLWSLFEKQEHYQEGPEKLIELFREHLISKGYEFLNFQKVKVG